jgi:hypothetical protein
MRVATSTLVCIDSGLQAPHSPTDAPLPDRDHGVSDRWRGCLSGGVQPPA